MDRARVGSPIHVASGLYGYKRRISPVSNDKQRTRQHAKTDKIDAQGLAKFAEVANLPAVKPKSEAGKRLKDLVFRRERLKSEITSLKNQSHIMVDKLLAWHNRQSRKLLGKQVEEIDAACRETVQGEADLARRFDILISIKGVGEATAMALIADMAELGTMTPKQAASPAGLAPMARDGGTMNGRRSIRGGGTFTRPLYGCPRGKPVQPRPESKISATHRQG